MPSAAPRAQAERRNTRSGAVQLAGAEDTSDPPLPRSGLGAMKMAGRRPPSGLALIVALCCCAAMANVSIGAGGRGWSGGMRPEAGGKSSGLTTPARRANGRIGCNVAAEGSSALPAVRSSFALPSGPSEVYLPSSGRFPPSRAAYAHAPQAKSCRRHMSSRCSTQSRTTKTSGELSGAGVARSALQGTQARGGHGGGTETP